MNERPSIGTRVRLLGHVGTVVAPPPPVVAGVPEEDPRRVWVAWDGSAISMLVDFDVISLEEPEPDWSRPLTKPPPGFTTEQWATVERAIEDATEIDENGERVVNVDKLNGRGTSESDE